MNVVLIAVMEQKIRNVEDRHRGHISRKRETGAD